MRTGSDHELPELVTSSVMRKFQSPQIHCFSAYHSGLHEEAVLPVKVLRRLIELGQDLPVPHRFVPDLQLRQLLCAQVKLVRAFPSRLHDRKRRSFLILNQSL